VLTAFEGGYEVADVEKAYAASKLCDFWRTNSNWLAAEKEVSCWNDVTGLSFIAPVWRKNPWKKIKTPKLELVDKPDESPEGIINFVKKTETETPDADVSFDAYHVLNTFCFPLNVKRWCDVRKLITADIVDMEYLEDNFDKIPDDIQPVAPEDINLAALERINNFVSAEFSLMSAVNPLEKQYLLLQYRERPTKKHPKGRYVVTVGGKVVRDEDLPYVEEARLIDPRDEHNISMGLIPWFAMDMAGRLVPPSPMELMRNAQIEYNQLLTDEWRNRQAVGRNKLIIERGMFNKDQYTDEHGELIEVEAASSFPPQFLQGQPLIGIDREIERKKTSLDDISGRYGMGRGENPTQVRSAFHLEILKEESGTIMNGSIRRRELVHEMAGKFALALAQRRMPKSRVIEICGEDIAGYALAFMSGNLLTDIRVQEGSAVPRNHASREEKLAQYLQYGAFVKKDGKPDMDLFWRMSELGTMNRGLDREEKHNMRARNENYVMLMKLPIIPVEFEDHTIHLEEIMDFMARPQFYNAPPEIQALFMAHLDTHRDMLMAQEAPEVFQQDQPPGLVEDAVKQMGSPQMAPANNTGMGGIAV
jgi:hypothetical protein